MLQTLLFFHLLGVAGLFSGLALEVLILMRLHRAATIAEVRAATVHAPAIPPLMATSTLLILSMGIAMVYVSGLGWSHAWIDVVLAVVVAFAVLAPVLVGRRLEAVHAAAAEERNAPMPPAIDNIRRAGSFNYVIFLGLFESVAALYLMIAKPAASEVIALFLLAAAAAVVPTALALRRDSAPAYVGQGQAVEAAKESSSV
jgi:uncharacterized membrane protein